MFLNCIHKVKSRGIIWKKNNTAEVREIVKARPVWMDVVYSLQGARFAELSADQVDKIAETRTSENTNQQTKWAIHIMRGEVY